ncbi:DEAD/DEAH box helicase [Caulobacter sp. NIBR1757]|uniref:DEAD/DEAH box helicase n=1 Tax=Caulobacter sp. NIBR1757 TaxID=3016000 RepID=UPI0022F0A7CA|nr:DEAD/DEAH box helicase [Caulobacter sp. NIBR1757]WGM39538.1 ATP-dependent RNA helicase RhlE [Caulobacter sp. NIBR1757]
MTEFSELGLSPLTLQAVIDAGYTVATPIQEQAIPVALAGRDVLGIAQTGTGKTAAFTLPMIDKLASGRTKARMPRGLVICPTRELADQVAQSFEKYAKGQKLTWALLIGGVSFGDQEMKLDRGVDVLIATPGRLLDHFERGKLLMTGVQTLVVDEADRMLDMGFIPDIERIFKMTPPKKQTLFFSATMPPEITRLTKQFLKDPTRIEVARPATTAETITQYLVRVPVISPSAKRMALRALVEKAEVRNGIVFCNRKSEVDIVAKSLTVHGHDAAPIHGDLDQGTRMKTLERFRKGELKLLVASDVAARGLDIPDVSHVFNYDVPHHADDYVHRIGRTGRAGKLGETYMIVTPADDKNLDKVLKLTGKMPNEVVLDLDWAAAKDKDARRKEIDKERGGSRGGDRGRERKREFSRGRPESETSMVGMDAISAPAERPERAPREDRPQRASTEPVFTAEETAPVEREERPRRERGGRGRDRKPRDEARREAAPVEAREERPVRDERPAREDRAAREERPERDERPARPERRPDPVRGVRAPTPRDDDDRRVVGFGNELPAFLARPVPTVAPSKDD